MAKVNVDDLTSEILKELSQYTNEVKDGVEVIKDEISKSTVNHLKQTSPKRFGTYAKSWTRKVFGKKIVIHVRAPHYRLTHLLELGHVKRNGGRTKKIVHIRPAEEKAVKEYVNRVERLISK